MIETLWPHTQVGQFKGNMESTQSKKHLFWQGFVTLAVLWSVGEAPLAFCMGFQLSPWNIGLDTLISIIFIADMIYHYKFGMEHSQVEWAEIEPYHQGKKYLKSAWFPIDLFSCVPFDLLAYATGLGGAVGLFRLIRLLRLFRILKLFELISSYTIVPKAVKIVSFTIGTTLVLHLIACGWLMITPDTVSPDKVTMYNKAFYWALTTLTTIGYGDITPSSNWGRIYTMFVMMGGVMFYAIIIGNFSRYLLEADRHKRRTKEKLSDLNLFMKHYKVPRQIKRQVFYFYNHILSQRLSENDSKIISELPMALKNELQVYMNMQLISDLPFFKGCSRECLKFLASCLEQKIFAPGETIGKKGDAGSDLFIIAHGVVEFSDPRHPERSYQLKDGQYFGEANLLVDSIRPQDLKARSYCDLYKLSKIDFEAVSELYPSLREQLEKALAFEFDKQTA